MNKRIKELMMQCWNTYYDQEVNGTRFPIVQKFDAEKFAELIVRECAGVIAEHFDPSEPWITPKTLLYHFGVKE
jgi:hypothetical protein